MMKISKTTRDEVEKIVNTHKRCVLETNSKYYEPKVIDAWTKDINKNNVLEQLKNSEWYTLKVGNKIAGFTQFDGETEDLYQINILPEYQSKGFGKKLYEFVEKKFIEKGKKRIVLNSSLNAIDFYKNLGFKEIKKIEFPSSVEGIYTPMVKMEKQLIKTTSVDRLHSKL